MDAPIDMVLHCPACGLQHIDAAEWINAGPDERGRRTPSVYTWTNPPHRSHLCHGCGHIWRPADVPTNGVAAVRTKGKNDSPIVSPADTIERLTAENAKLIALLSDIDANMRRAWADRTLAAEAWPATLAKRLTEALQEASK